MTKEVCQVRWRKIYFPLYKKNRSSIYKPQYRLIKGIFTSLLNPSSTNQASTESLICDLLSLLILLGRKLPKDQIADMKWQWSQEPSAPKEAHPFLLLYQTLRVNTGRDWKATRPTLVHLTIIVLVFLHFSSTKMCCASTMSQVFAPGNAKISNSQG